MPSWGSHYAGIASARIPNDYDGDPRVFYPDSSCAPFLWSDSINVFGLGNNFRVGGFTIPRGMKGVIASVCNQTTGAQMKLTARLMLHRSGSITAQPAIPIHGALTDVFESGHLSAGSDGNVAGIAGLWQTGPYPCNIVLEDGEYSLEGIGYDQLFYGPELFGWLWREKEPPDFPRRARKQRRAERVWRPDETCAPFFLSASRMGEGADQHAVMMEFRVPQGTHAIISVMSYGDTVSFQKLQNAAMFTRSFKDPLTYSIGADMAHFPQGITEKEELDAFAINAPGFAPILSVKPMQRNVRLGAGLYRAIRLTTGIIGMLMVCYGWTFREEQI